MFLGGCELQYVSLLILGVLSVVLSQPFNPWGDAPSYAMSDFQSDCFFIDGCVLKIERLGLRLIDG